MMRRKLANQPLVTLSKITHENNMVGQHQVLSDPGYIFRARVPSFISPFLPDSDGANDGDRAVSCERRRAEIRQIPNRINQPNINTGDLTF